MKMRTPGCGIETTCIVKCAETQPGSGRRSEKKMEDELQKV
jgi:hypothetical protein